MIDDLEQLFNNQEEFNKNLKDQLNKQLVCFQYKASNIRKLLATIGKSEEQEIIETTKMKRQQIVIQEENIIQSMAQKFSYEMIKESTLKQNNSCHSFAFNRDNSVACQKEIIVYLFIKGKISKEVQRLYHHTKSVYCLYFMRNSNSFVSGSLDYSITIWELDQNNNKYIAQQVLNDHKNSIRCVIMNKNDDYIISGSGDVTLKIWRKVSGSWACSQSINTEYTVRNMSLNEVEDKLITCQYNHLSSVQVLLLQKDQKWSIVQSLHFQGYINRLCFTVGDQFVTQNRSSNFLEIYDYDENKNEFKVVSQVQMQQIKSCDDLFPCQFIKSLNHLTFKHGEYLNLYKVNENYNYELIQTVQYRNQYLYGRMTDDGSYLVTWDDSSKEIQIRQQNI